jgi:hypothetical protein
MISENHSGIIWSLAALIILTLSGVFLSLLVEKRLTFSQTRNTIAQDIAKNDLIIDGFRSELEGKQQQFAASEARALRTAADVGGIGSVFKEFKAEMESLAGRKSKLQAVIPELEQTFADCRGKYRSAEWAKASGERIDSLFLKSGRQFERVVISRVTPFGLEISHADGNARVDFKDLGNDYRERFQWDEEEREEVLAKERRNRLRLSPSRREATPSPEVDTTPTAARDGSAITALRSEIQLLRSKLSSLRIEYSQASSQSRYGSNRSVPGSLRTWGEQAEILKTEIARAEARLALSSEKLRALSPGDPYLTVPR